MKPARSPARWLLLQLGHPGLPGWEGSVHHWKHGRKHVQALAVWAKLHRDSEEMLAATCPERTSFLGWDMDVQPGQIHVGCGSEAQEHLMSLPPAERSVSGLFELK